MLKCAHHPGKGIRSRKFQIFRLPDWRVASDELKLCRALLGCSASAQKGASPFHQKPSSSVAFLQWIHFLDAKHLYLLVLPFEQCLWLVCFELHYRLECNCGESIFILPRVAANHSYMLQRIYNCLVWYVCFLTAFEKFYGEEYTWF